MTLEFKPLSFDKNDCNEFYWTYTDKVPQGDILRILGDNGLQTATLLRSIRGDRETYAYAEGKWTIRELAGHMVDTERLFAFRAFWFARGEEGPLPGMDEKAFAAHSNAGDRPLAQIIAEMENVRASTLSLFRSFDSAAWQRRGEASGFPITVRALPFIIAGHEIHHRRVLQERYLQAA